MIKRRDFLASLAAIPLFGCRPASISELPQGQDLSSGHALGHRLRSGLTPASPHQKRRTGIVIIGGGISGLAAGWWLQKQGFDDFLVLEMNEEPGGNSRSGQAAPGQLPFPLGAHYLPLPSPEARYVRELLAELGALTGAVDALKPTYDENRLCAQPQERVYRQGLWEEGLLPHIGISSAARTEYQRFSEVMQHLKQKRGKDGKRIFALPMALASQDPAWRALDQQTFHDWLLANNFHDPELHWLANYACRDDYGADYRQTSAWAGLHYFACRIGEAANAQSDCVLTAPEGNAWLMRGLASPLKDRIETHSLVAHIEAQKQTVTVDVLDGAKNHWSQIEARHVIWASPHFILPKVWPALPSGILSDLAAPSYAPWLVMNLHLSHPLPEKNGTPLAWDNLLRTGDTLGYVVNTHQQIRRHPGPSVLTCYRTFENLSPQAARQTLLNTPAEHWKTQQLAELAPVYPDLLSHVTRMDIFRHGHAMARPTPGSLFHSPRERLCALQDRFLSLAHADLSGFSLFEEAQYRGVEAARHALQRLGRRPTA